MKTTPKSLRLHIALFGRTNVGKSSFLNLIAGQDVAIVSSQPGTTTDVVEKPMELLPIGPVVFLDTAGIDDTTALGEKRISKTEKVFDRADVIVLLHEGDQVTDFEEEVSAKAEARKIPVIRIANKSDQYDVSDQYDLSCNSTDISTRDHVLAELKAELLRVCPAEFITPPPLMGDLVKPGGLAMLIVPIDLQAPKGRLILPQVSTIRDALDNDAATLVCKEREYAHMLSILKQKPDVAICDSQMVLKMVADTPPEIPCTTFSILFARIKGDLRKFAMGAAAIDRLEPGDKVLIAESCSHHALEDDIGRVKIPRWLRQYVGVDVQIDVYSGRDFPDNLLDYKLAVQCGGCMQNRREVLSRIEKCESAGVPITNYGMCIAQTQGVLKRVLSPFPAALDAYEKEMKRGLPKVETEGLKSFIPEDEIFQWLEKTKNPAPERVREIIQRSLDKNRLEPEEMATLINADSPELAEEIFEGARELKKRIYGNRIVLFAPLYVGNECVNKCEYCGFRADNSEVHRKTLLSGELVAEVEALEDLGHKRLIMVYGEHPKYDAQYIHDTVQEVYKVKKGPGEIRRVNINAAPLNVEGFKMVKAAGIGTYQIFQETYHRETYEKVHKAGPKSNYLWRLHGLDRAMEAGIDDLGIGALLGLYDWRFETMALLYHTIHLEERFNVGPHTISFPRLEPAVGTDIDKITEGHEVSDYDFKRLVAILRLAVPYTGLILTCRESTELRNEMLSFGVSQIDGGSSIGVGSYSNDDPEAFRKSQFLLGDNRSLDEVIRELCDADFVPSFCTGCYRKGRTGEHFMEFAIPGFVKRFCTPNAVLTFLEYLNDYATGETLEAGLQQIGRELDALPESQAKAELEERMAQVRAGERDLYF